MSNIDRLYQIDTVDLPAAKRAVQDVEAGRRVVEDKCSEIRAEANARMQADQKAAWADFDAKIQGVQDTAAAVARERKDIRKQIEREVGKSRRVFKLADGSLLLWENGDYSIMKEGDVMVVREGDVVPA